MKKTFGDDVPSLAPYDAMMGIHLVEFGAIEAESRDIEENPSVRQVRLGNLVSAESLGDLDGVAACVEGMSESRDRSELRQPLPEEVMNPNLESRQIPGAPIVFEGNASSSARTAAGSTPHTSSKGRMPWDTFLV